MVWQEAATMPEAAVAGKTGTDEGAGGMPEPLGLGADKEAKEVSRKRKGNGEAKGKSPGKSQGERNRELGRRGEDAAARFLERRGYDIVARNWTCFAGEADIIARDGAAVVFVEVKTRSSYAKGLPGEAVGKSKRERYEKIAAAFLSEYEVVDVPLRFDVVSIVLVAPDRAMIRHHIDAFGVG